MPRAKHRLLIGILGLGMAWGAVAALAQQETLLDITHGQLPSDTGTDKTFFNRAACPALAGPALKVVCPAGDSFGDRTSKVTNWKKFTHVEFQIFNPSFEPVALGFNIKHARSVSYATRLDIPLQIAPGKNDFKIALRDLTNVDGSAPALDQVVRWYLANTTANPVTLFIGDISLTGSNASAAAASNLSPPIATALPSEESTRRPARMPEFHTPVLFNTPEADAILSALEVYPPDNPWNQIITNWPVHPNSQNIIASIGADRPLRYNPDMGFVLIPPDQTRIPVKIVAYPAESDHGPFPIADNTPIEGWPSYYQSEPRFRDLTLTDVQRDKLKLGGDRHGIVVDPVNRMLYEFFVLTKTDQGWQADQASTFDLKTNRLRPAGWTSADAAGLPIFPATVRYDELKRGIITHALRVTVRRSRQAYVAPATHYASRLSDSNLPRMGERIRLRQDFDVTGFSPEVQTILKGLQTYGMFVADNGIDWAISVTPDERIPLLHEELRRIRGASFEVVVPPTP